MSPVWDESGPISCHRPCQGRGGGYEDTVPLSVVSKEQTEFDTCIIIFGGHSATVAVVPDTVSLPTVRQTVSQCEKPVYPYSA